MKIQRMHNTIEEIEHSDAQISGCVGRITKRCEQLTPKRNTIDFSSWIKTDSPPKVLNVKPNLARSARAHQNVVVEVKKALSKLDALRREDDEFYLSCASRMSNLHACCQMIVDEATCRAEAAEEQNAQLKKMIRIVVAQRDILKGQNSELRKQINQATNINK